MNVYFISGVGADRRIFRNLQLPPGYTENHLDWIPPQKNETLASYALRLSEGINKNEPFMLAGLSFGGMLANEIARVYSPELVILISSIPSSRQLPPYYSLAGKIGLQKMIPVSLLKSMSLLKRLFTAETTEQKKFLRQAIRDADPAFIKWSLDAIVNWRNGQKPREYIHIHGSGDLVLPARYSGYTHLIKGGGHLMILTRAEEISRIIRDEILERGMGNDEWAMKNDK